MVRESVIIFEPSDGSIEDEDTIVEKVNNLVSEVSMEEENIDQEEIGWRSARNIISTTLAKRLMCSRYEEVDNTKVIEIISRRL